MRLPDQYLSCVAYLGWPAPDRSGQFRSHGTGFFVEHEGAHYLVTAAHVAVDLAGRPFAIRLNKAADGLGDVQLVDTAVWQFHPDDTIDVAVLPFDPPAWAQTHAFPTKFAVTEFKRQSKDIGPGDLAYIVGMFSPLQGRDKNTPAVHMGHVASVPGERVGAED